jgi:hypothetical protein
MSAEIRQEISKLLDQVNELDRTPEGVAAAEEAVRLADSLEDAELGFESREALIGQAAFSGNPDKLLVAFSWCLAHADNHPKWEPDSWQAISLLWRYKWVVENAIDFPGISRERILAMIEDFRGRCLRAGYTERPALDLRFTAERRMGNLSAAQEWLDRWLVVPRDSMADCEACELHGVITLLIDSGRHAEAIEKAGPILKGRLHCAEIPHKTLGSLLESFWQTNQTAKAAQCHAQGYRLVRAHRAFAVEHGAHLLYLVRLGQPEKALTLLRKHLPWALETRSLEDRFRFLLAASKLLHTLLEQDSTSVRIRLDPCLCPMASKATINVRVLHDWVTSLLCDIARQFDARNGNLWYSSRIERLASPQDSKAA